MAHAVIEIANAPKALSALDRPHSNTVLVLQGGGALGAYQAGVYEELARAEHMPDWIAGVSIGAINAAIIAGNEPEKRVEKLAEFWQLVSQSCGMPTAMLWALPWPEDLSSVNQLHSASNQFSALWSTMIGIPGMCYPRMPTDWFQTIDGPGPLSLYDTEPLRATLERLIDFDRINSRKVRLSVGAVNVGTGNSQYFDNFEHIITPEHIMASGALPPAFPPIMIDGDAYWDGGLVSNTPLQYVLDVCGRDRLLIFQVDLFSARGKIPINLSEVQQRQKDIRYSSRTRYNSNMAAEVAAAHGVIDELLARLPEHIRQDRDIVRIANSIRAVPMDIVHLIYRKTAYEQESKDYEFSHSSVLAHWAAGRSDMCDTLTHPKWLKASGSLDSVMQYDLTKHSKPT